MSRVEHEQRAHPKGICSAAHSSRLEVGVYALKGCLSAAGLASEFDKSTSLHTEIPRSSKSHSVCLSAAGSFKTRR